MVGSDGSQRHLLPKVDLDVLIYERVVLVTIDFLSSINISRPHVLKTKRECLILVKDWFFKFLMIIHEEHLDTLTDLVISYLSF